VDRDRGTAGRRGQYTSASNLDIVGCMDSGLRFRRGLRFVGTRLAEWRMIGWGLLAPNHPVLAHIIPTRRCNLSCAYCNEYDDVSKPVPLAEMFRRVDKLGELGTSIITQSGGEPLLHPELDQIIARVRKTGAIAGMITNGYLLTADRIRRLNRAGLLHLQISIDNTMPDEISKKSLKVLDQKLVLLAEHAEFQVNINSVLGSGVKNPVDALAVARRALELGFTSTVGVLHDHGGQLKPLAPHEQKIFEQVMTLGKRSYSRFNQFQHNIARGKPNAWRCRSGARYLYICEDGLVHWCSQQRGYPGTPLAEYTLKDFRREYLTEKPCAPLCTVSCSQQVAMLDNWRAPQTLRPRPVAQPDAGQLVHLTGASTQRQE